MWLGAIYWGRIDRVYFGNLAEDAAKIGFDDSFIYAELNRPAGERRIPLVHMMREEAAAAFRAWVELPERVRY